MASTLYRSKSPWIVVGSFVHGGRGSAAGCGLAAIAGFKYFVSNLRLGRRDGSVVKGQKRRDRKSEIENMGV